MLIFKNKSEKGSIYHFIIIYLIITIIIKNPLSFLGPTHLKVLCTLVHWLKLTTQPEKEVQRRMAKSLRSCLLTRKTKLTLYKTLIMPVLIYSLETWPLYRSDANSLMLIELARIIEHCSPLLRDFLRFSRI